jgi:ribosomal protein L34E
MVYYRKVDPKDSMFAGRASTVVGAGEGMVVAHVTRVPDSVVICNGCNENLYPDKTGHLVYLDKRELKANHPYDVYCERCLRRLFPGAKDAALA